MEGSHTNVWQQKDNVRRSHNTSLYGVHFEFAEVSQAAQSRKVKFSDMYVADRIEVVALRVPSAQRPTV